MSETDILLKAYYEALYELLDEKKDILSERIEELIAEEISIRGFEDFDDDYEPGAVHVGCGVIPAAFALAESRAENGKNLIAAVVAGYEIACRAAGALALKEKRAGYHITGAVGGFGWARHPI